ncbi:MAG: MCE family protein [Hyphomicrobiales bacterium]|nr:MCE family protein [Hyphomicrobiales bacterium]MDE2016597.1 MCE family protein [Hyphomicrobiales bacterium]
METRANDVLVGLFTLAVVVAGFLFFFWFSGGAKDAGRVKYEIDFSDSVAGLSRGSNVLFNGLNVGTVETIDFSTGDPRLVSAVVAVNARTPIRADTTARLQIQGLTGASAIALSGGAADAKPLAAPPGGGLPVIHAERSDLQNILENVQRMSTRADSVLGKLDDLLGRNSKTVDETVANLHEFSAALAANSDGVKAFMTSVGDIGKQLAPLTAKAQTLADDLDTLAKSIDAKKLNAAIDDVGKVTATLAANRDRFDKLMESASDLSRQLATSAPALQDALDNVAALSKAIDVGKVRDAVTSFADVAKTVDANRAGIDATLKNAAAISAKLNAAADKIDSTMTALQGFLGQPGSSSAVADVGAAARAIRTLADNLDARTKTIAAGIDKFTGQGLRQYEGLAVDARRSLDQLNRSVNSLRRDPQQLIFGPKGSIPDYVGGK